MLNYETCDFCEGHTYTEDNPFVECRVPRPSNPAEMSCVMAGHLRCVRSGKGIARGGGTATPEEWQAWIDGPGKELGYLWLG